MWGSPDSKFDVETYWPKRAGAPQYAAATRLADHLKHHVDLVEDSCRRKYHTPYGTTDESCHDMFLIFGFDKD